jgi:GNAT superfamily N-acetyltransferase
VASRGPSRPASWSRLDDVLVVTRCADLRGLPPPDAASPYRVEPLDMSDPADVTRWLTVLNAAFGRRWGPAEHRRALLCHPVVRIRHTVAAVAPDGTVAGVASVGVFRADEEVGLGHYLCVLPAAQGSGVGRLLLRHRYRLLADEGIRVAESQTHLSRRRSLLLHFEHGFVPKYRHDPWNSPDPSPRALRWTARARLWALHRAWVRGSATGGAPARPAARTDADTDR